MVIIFNENKKRYGYRRITKELHNNNICVNHKTVQKLMKQLGLVCQVRVKRKYNSYKGEVGEVAPNLLERHFKTNQPNRKWVTDVTEFKVNDQKLYLSPILDLFNGEVVSYNLSRHPNFKQITDMLEGAFQKLPDKVDNLILHSDQGWQYQMKSYQNLLKAKGITQSMSRKATCLDNAVAEDFFGLLKTELFYLEKFDSIDQLEKAIVDYIDYYNNRRIKLASYKWLSRPLLFFNKSNADTVYFLRSRTSFQSDAVYSRSLNILLPGAIIKENGKEVHLCSTPVCMNRSSTTH